MANEKNEKFSTTGAVSIFCTVWPLLKDGLTLLEEKDPKLKPTIDKVIAAGNELSGLICK